MNIDTTFLSLSSSTEEDMDCIMLCHSPPHFSHLIGDHLLLRSRHVSSLLTCTRGLQILPFHINIISTCSFTANTKLGSIGWLVIKTYFFCYFAVSSLDPLSCPGTLEKKTCPVLLISLNFWLTPLAYRQTQTIIVSHVNCPTLSERPCWRLFGPPLWCPFPFRMPLKKCVDNSLLNVLDPYVSTSTEECSIGTGTDQIYSGKPIAKVVILRSEKLFRACF